MKKVLCIVLALVLVLSLTACGGGKQPAGKTFTVATNCPFEPFEYIGSDGLVYGIDWKSPQNFAKQKVILL